ncbi:ATP13A1 [Symbiodinium microadriaticum]|nr:ATP13A1 [Symbiodinium microadriaticum]
MFYNSTGHKGPRDVDIALRKWGTNDFDIPLPDFVDLYTEHLVAPFFVFQILCLVLWSLDDYWYYSALTLVMLLFFEGVLAKQRLVSLQNLRAMNREPSPVYVFRRSKWELISSEQLVPGDVMSLSFEPTREIGLNSRKMSTATANTSEKIVPCDALLIRGSCVVNEAMLTGESVPQVKESLRVASNDDSDGSGEMKQGMIHKCVLVDVRTDGGELPTYNIP